MKDFLQKTSEALLRRDVEIRVVEMENSGEIDYIDGIPTISIKRSDNITQKVTTLLHEMAHYFYPNQGEDLIENRAVSEIASMDFVLVMYFYSLIEALCEK